MQCTIHVSATYSCVCVWLYVCMCACVFYDVFVTSTEGCTEGGNEYEDGDVWTCSDGCNTW